jgi:holo-[acyl-carrier protein] synthase
MGESITVIIGVGIDLVSIERISRVYKKYPERFLMRLFSDRELASFKEHGSNFASLAARFAAKEAVLKAIGCGIGPAALNEVEIITSPGQQPQVKLLAKTLDLAGERGINAFSLSMTHEPPFACAIAAAYQNGDASKDG